MDMFLFTYFDSKKVVNLNWTEAMLMVLEQFEEAEKLLKFLEKKIIRSIPLNQGKVSLLTNNHFVEAHMNQG